MYRRLQILFVWLAVISCQPLYGQITHLVAGAANGPGLNGSQWRTDLQVRNSGDDNYFLRIAFLPDGDSIDESNIWSFPALNIVVYPNTTTTIENVVGSIQDQISGSGSLFLIGDGDASRVGITTRTYSMGTSGETYGQLRSSYRNPENELGPMKSRGQCLDSRIEFRPEAWCGCFSGLVFRI